jgi:uncharacterized damage-inducible protein DinB
MDRQTFFAKLDYFNMVHGLTLRAIDALSDSDLDFRPQSGMRTARELIFHIYSQEKLLAEAARVGKFTSEAAGESSPENKATAATLQALGTGSQLREYAEACHRAAEAIYREMPEEDLSRPVESPFGAYPAWRYFDFAYDEHWHHRGQLYTYLRLLGKEPPMLYDY